MWEQGYCLNCVTYWLPAILHKMFHIPVKINGLERRRRSTGLLHVAAGFFLIANVSSVYKILGINALWIFAGFLLPTIASIFYGIFRKKLDPQNRYNASLRWAQCAAFVVLAILILVKGNTPQSLGIFIWAILSAVLVFTESIALKQPQMIFAEDGIAFPAGFGLKKFGWNELEDVRLRPDFLTLYFPQNKYLQFELSEAPDSATTEKMQDFCRRHLKKAVAGS